VVVTCYNSGYEYCILSQVHTSYSACLQYAVLKSPGYLLLNSHYSQYYWQCLRLNLEPSEHYTCILQFNKLYWHKHYGLSNPLLQLVKEIQVLKWTCDLNENICCVVKTLNAILHQCAKSKLRCGCQKNFCIFLYIMSWSYKHKSTKWHHAMQIFINRLLRKIFNILHNFHWRNVEIHTRETSGSANQTVEMEVVKVKVKQSHYRSWQVLRVPGGWGSHILTQLVHEGGTVVSPMHRLPLPPVNIPGTHFC
jgi:hypothetical protein